MARHGFEHLGPRKGLKVRRSSVKALKPRKAARPRKRKQK